MKKLYVDRTENNECIALFIEGAEIISAGTTIYSMPKKEYNAEYKKFADEYDVKFIFDDCIPHIDFYTVPQFDIMATDSEGGYIGTIGGVSDLGSDFSIGYIDKNNNCYLIASCGKEFLENAANWKESKQVYDGVEFYASKEDAHSKLKFIDIPKLDVENLSEEL